MRTAKTLIRLGGCPSWSESSLGAQSFFFFFSCRGSYVPLLCQPDSCHQYFARYYAALKKLPDPLVYHNLWVKVLKFAPRFCSDLFIILWSLFRVAFYLLCLWILKCLISSSCMFRNLRFYIFLSERLHFFVIETKFFSWVIVANVFWA